MSRVCLVHWSPEEGEERASRLRQASHTVKLVTPRRGDSLQSLLVSPPDAFVIDLGRLPAQGRDLAVWLRGRKAGRHIPIVFVGGDPEKVAQVRKLLPDAVYTEWRRIRAAIRDAIRNPPADPVRPGAMAGYSGTPLPKKLGIKTGSVVTLLGAPDDFEETLGKLPDEVRLRRRAGGRADLVLLFTKRLAELERRFPVAVRTTAERGSLWIAWPKQASGVATDLTQNRVRGYGLDRGLVDFKICAIDETWSGLRFARRKS
jgi:CheY-like chemotaxis protein